MCGRLAEGLADPRSGRLPGPVAARLRVPPPLETDLELAREGDGVVLRHGATRVAEARPAALELEPPAPPSPDAAAAAARAYRGHREHWFPRCFVCGPERAEGDGLRIFPGPLGAGRGVACPWTPDASLGDDAGRVRPEFVWAAIDCPGAFAFDAPAGGRVLLGQLTAELRAGVGVGEPCVLLAWETARDGRRHTTASVLYGADGSWRARAEGLWFEVA